MIGFRLQGFTRYRKITIDGQDLENVNKIFRTLELGMRHTAMSRLIRIQAG